MIKSIGNIIAVDENEYRCAQCLDICDDPNGIFQNGRDVCDACAHEVIDELRQEICALNVQIDVLRVFIRDMTGYHAEEVIE